MSFSLVQNLKKQHVPFPPALISSLCEALFKKRPGRTACFDILCQMNYTHLLSHWNGLILRGSSSQRSATLQLYRERFKSV